MNFVCMPSKNNDLEYLLGGLPSLRACQGHGSKKHVVVHGLLARNSARTRILQKGPLYQLVRQLSLGSIREPTQVPCPDPCSCTKPNLEVGVM